MPEFVPKTGAVIDRLRRPEPLDEREQWFARWCAERGLIAVFGKCSPLEDDEDFDPFFTYEMGIEEFVNDKIVACFRSVRLELEWAEYWEMEAQMLRLAFDRTKAEVAAA